MSNHESLSDAARRLLSQLDQAPAEVTQSRRHTFRDPHAEAASEKVAEQTDAFDATKNVFAQTMSGEGTDEDKAKAIRDKVVATQGDPLALRPEDLVAVNASFAAFEAFHAHIQDSSIDTDMASIREFIDRIENSISPEMKRMIQSLTSTNSDIHECRDLLDVLKVARMLDKTIEQLQAAIQENDRLEREIGGKKGDVVRAEREHAAYIDHVKAVEDSIAADKQTFWGGLRQAVVGVPQELTERLQHYKDGEAAAKATIERHQKLQADLERQLETGLNEGPLKILRSFDMTQDGLEKKIASAARNVIDVVETIRRSVKTLLVRVDRSEVAMADIVQKIDHNRIDRTLLVSSLTEAYQINQKQADTVGAKVEELQATLDGLAADSVQAGKARIDFMKLNTTHKGLLAYGERVNTMLRMLHTNDATSVLASNEAETTLESVKNNKEGLNMLHNSTLPSLSEAMRLVLYQFVDVQDQEYRMAIGEVTKNLGNTAEGTAERALNQQKLFQQKKVEQLEALIGRLDSASDLLGRAMEESVKAAVTEEKTYRRVSVAADNLRDGVNAAGSVRAQVREHVRVAREAAEADVKSTGDKEPTRGGGGFVLPPKATSMALAA